MRTLSVENEGTDDVSVVVGWAAFVWHDHLTPETEAMAAQQGTADTIFIVTEHRQKNTISVLPKMGHKKIILNETILWKRLMALLQGV